MDQYERLTREHLIAMVRGQDQDGKHHLVNGSRPVPVPGTIDAAQWRAAIESRRPIFVIDAETLKYLAVNDACVSLYGYTKTEFLDRTLMDTWRLDVSTSAPDAFTVYGTNIRLLNECRHATKSGASISVETVVQDIQFQGRAAFLCEIKNVTERARELESLRRREYELGALLENTPDIISRLDRDFRHIYVSPAIIYATGRPPEEFIGKTISEVNLPADLGARWDRTLKEVFSTAREQVLECSFVGPNGARYYESRIIPEKDFEMVQTVLVITRDFTQRKEAEDLLRQREQEFQTLAENIPDLVARFDSQGRYIYLNHAVEVASGFQRENMIGRTHRELGLPANFVDAFEKSHEIATTTEMPHTFECSVVLSNDERFFEAHHVPEKKAGSSGITILSIARDITERKKYESAMQRSLSISRLLESLARATNEAITPEAAMAACLDLICRHGGWVLGRVAILGHPAVHSPPRSIWFAPNKLRFRDFIETSNKRGYEGGGEFISRVLKNRVPVWVENLQDLGIFYRKAAAIACGIRAGFAFPIVVHDSVVALIEVFSTRRIARDSQLIEATHSIASQLSRLVERERTHDANALLASIVESSQDAIFSRSLDGTVLTWNVGAEQLFGYKSEEIIGQNLEILVPNELRQDTAERIRRTNKGEVPRNFETTRVGKGGRRVDVSLAVSVVRDINGAVLAVSTVIRDISLRRIMERELQHHKRLLLAVIDNLPVSLIVKDAKSFRLLMMNRVAEEMTFLHRDESIGKTAHELFPKEQADTYIWSDLRALVSKEMVEIPEHRVVNRAGETRVRRTRKIPIFYDNGDPWVLVGVGEDITEKVKAENELRGQKKLLDTIIEHLPVGITVKDAHTKRYLVRNRLAKDLTGVGQEGIGKTAEELYTPDLARLVRSTDEDALASGGAVVGSPRLAQFASGRIVRNLKVPVPDEAGHCAHIVTILDDISDIETAQQALRRSEERLAQLVSMSPVVIFTFRVDRPYVTTFISDNVDLHVGWTPSDFKAKETFWIDQIHPDDRVQAMEKMDAIEVDGKYHSEYRFRHRNGTWRRMRDEGRIVRDDGSSELEVIGSWTDVTAEHKESEERLARAFVQRDALVREVHHRIKNNIQGVIGLMRRKIKKSDTGAPVIEEAIGQLQTIATVYGLESKLPNTPLSLTGILESISMLAEELSGERVKRLYPTADETPVLVVADEAVAVAVALNELIFNAVKHQAVGHQNGSVAIILNVDSNAATIRITNRGRLPPEFDFSSGYGLNEGLDLVRTLLLQPGSEVEFSCKDDEVAAVLTLRAPLLARTARTVSTS